MFKVGHFTNMGAKFSKVVQTIQYGAHSKALEPLKRAVWKMAVSRHSVKIQKIALEMRLNRKVTGSKTREKYKKILNLSIQGLNFESRPNHTIRGTFECPTRLWKFLDYFYSQLFDMLHIQRAEKVSIYRTKKFITTKYRPGNSKTAFFVVIGWIPWTHKWGSPIGWVEGNLTGKWCEPCLLPGLNSVV